MTHAAPTIVFPVVLAALTAAAAQFQVVDQLDHQDPGWANMLAGDADGDGFAEIVQRVVPVAGPGPAKLVFYEDDGSGDYHVAHSFVVGDEGLLALGDVDGDGLADLFTERLLGSCSFEYVRYEASTLGGFPGQEVWSGVKNGIVIDYPAALADLDQDGLVELVTSDNNAEFTCGGLSALKVFEARPGDQMELTASLTTPHALGNPVVADLDLDGQREVAASDASGVLRVWEQAGSVLALTQANVLGIANAFWVALIERRAPGVRPMVFVAGQGGTYRLQAWQAGASGVLQKQNELVLPSACGFSVVQLAAADVAGSAAAELVVAGLCGSVAVVAVGGGAAMTIVDLAAVEDGVGLAVHAKSSGHSGTIAVAEGVTAANPEGRTQVLLVP